MFHQNKTNLNKLGEKMDAVAKVTEGKNENEIVKIMLDEISSAYGEDKIIGSFLTFIQKHRKEVLCTEACQN
ncbi:MAG: hypothetical protein QW292_07290 [Candidatus Parvarchaeota archaeon]